MKKLFFFLTILVPVMVAAGSPSASQHEKAEKIINNPTINFRKNLGQWNEKILFQGANQNAQIRFLENGMSFAFIREKEGTQDAKEFMVWNVEFDRANEDMKVTSDYKSDSKTNYLFGTDRSQWVKNAPDFKKVSYNNVYDNIDLHYYSVGRELKYDYIVYPKGDIGDIRMRLSGVEGIDINRSGELEIATEWGVLLEKRPYSYQFVNGVKKEVDVRYELQSDNSYGFKVYGDYNKTLPLVIDPVILNYCTYVAGNSGFGYVNETKVNKDGELFGTGWTTGHFPITPGVYDNTQACCGGVPNAFVFRMNREGTGLIYATYMGKSGSQANGRSLAIAKNNDVYVLAKSRDGMPITANAYKNDGDFNGSAIFRLTNDGTNVTYGTYTDLGELKDLTLDQNEDVYVTGHYARVGKFSKDLSTKYYEYQPGGANKNSWGYDIVALDNGEAYVAGVAGSNQETTAGAYQTSSAGIFDGFVYKVAADGQSLIYSTLLGGDGIDEARALDIDKDGNVYVAGHTQSSNFKLSANAYIKNTGYPTAPAPNDGCPQAFVVKFNPALSNAIYSTFIGGLKGNYDAVQASMGCAQIATGIAVSSKGQAVITGFTAADDFPATTCNTQFTNFNGRLDCFVVRLNEDGTDAYYSALIAGNDWDYGGTSAEKGRASVTLLEDACQELEAFVSISTHSYDWPTTTGAFQETLPGAVDQPVVYDLKPVIEPEFSNSTPRCDQAVQFTDLTTGSCVQNWATSNWSPSSWVWDFGDGTTSTEQHPSHFFAKPGRYEVTLRVMCPEDSITHIVDIPNPFNELELGQDLNVCPEVTLNETLDAGTQPGGTTFNWNTGATTQSIIATQPGKYFVTISDGSCIATDTINITQEKITGAVEKTKPSCFQGVDGSIKALPNTGVEPFNYVWSNGQTTQTATGLGAGDHTVKVTDSRGCELEATISLNEPDPITANLSVVDANCDGTGGGATATASGGSGGLMFSWTDGTTTVSGPEVTDLPVGDYKLIVTDINNCEISKSFAIKEQQSPVSVNLTLKQDADCSGQGGSATVTPSGGAGTYTYQWDNGQTTRTATNLSAGDHTVTVTDAKGCTGNLSINIESSGSLEVQAGSTVVHGCDRQGAVNADASVTVSGGSSPYSYQWNDPKAQTTATATGLPTGTYTVTVTDQGGCSSKATVVIEDIIQLDAKVVSDPSCVSCADGEATVNIGGTGTPPYTYRWNDENQQTTATATGLKPGVYVITVFDDKDCSNTDTVTVGNITGVEDEGHISGSLRIYPNPNSGSFRIDAGNLDMNNSVIRIRDIRGKLVYHLEQEKLNDYIELDDQPDGIYILEILTNKYVITRRLYLSR